MEWTDAHQREARARLLELAAEMVRAGRDRAADWLSERAVGVYDLTEARFRGVLDASTDEPNPVVDTARIDREVRRVRALAEGRLVREPTWLEVRDESGHGRAWYADREPERSHARAAARKPGYRLFRLRGIRRPVP